MFLTGCIMWHSYLSFSSGNTKIRIWFHLESFKQYFTISYRYIDSKVERRKNGWLVSCGCWTALQLLLRLFMWWILQQFRISECDNFNTESSEWEQSVAITVKVTFRSQVFFHIWAEITIIANYDMVLLHSITTK